MGYLQNNLLHDENIIAITRPHWIVFFSPIVFVLLSLFILTYLPSRLQVLNTIQLAGFKVFHLMALLTFTIAIFEFTKALIFHLKSEYGITNKRILMKEGWIQRQSIEIFLEKVEAIYVDQTIAGRFLGYGTIMIVGTGGSKDPFLYVPKPLLFRKIAQQQIDILETQRHEHY